MPKWRIYYDGGATFEGEPEKAPFFGALLVVEQDEEHGRRFVIGDYFVYDVERGRWWGVDKDGRNDYLQRPGWKRYLVGRMLPNKEWIEVWRRAEADVDFPPRTGFGAHERKLYNVS